jgi:radical SAM protein with 4Fe4S-binding SPASM domain
LKITTKTKDANKVGTKKRFSKIYIEISNLCNLQCTFCPEVLRDKKILNIEDFKKIINSVELLTDTITLHLMGEPLLHPHFAEMMVIINESTLAVDLTSNGILLKKHQDLILRSNSIRQINFSLQSYLDNFPGRSLNSYLQPILEFVHLAQEQRPDLFVNLRLWNLQTDGEVQSQGMTIPSELENLLAVFSDLFKRELPQFIEVKSKKSWKLTEKIRIHWDTRFEWPSLKNNVVGENGYCYGLKSHIGIHADGTVVPCCLDKEAEINLGNIFELPLVEIINTNRAKNLLQSFEKGIACEELCQKCSFKDRFQNIMNKKLVQASKK